MLYTLDDTNGFISDDDEIPSCWLLGHPYFVENDCRGYAGPDDDADLMNWLSLISFTTCSDDELFMWGDSGDATVLVPAKDLETLNLSRTWYSWDCY